MKQNNKNRNLEEITPELKPLIYIIEVFIIVVIVIVIIYSII